MFNGITKLNHKINLSDCPKNKNHKIKWSMVLQNKIIKLI